MTLHARFRPISPLLGLALALGAIATPASAQIDDCTYLVSAWDPSYGTGGPGGLFLVDARTPNSCPTAIANVNPELEALGNTWGASTVIKHPNGNLLVGTAGAPLAQITLHEVTLSATGTSVVAETVYSIGTVGQNYPEGGVYQMAVLPDGDVIVGLWGIVSGPLGGFELARWTPTTGALVGVPVSNLPSNWNGLNALAVDPTGQTLLIGEWFPQLTRFWEVPVTGGALSLCGTLPWGVTAMAYDDNLGKFVAVTIGFGPNVYQVDHPGCQKTPIPTSVNVLNAITIEGVTGDYGFTTQNAGSHPSSVGWMTPSGDTTILSFGGCGSWSIPSGIVSFQDEGPVGAAYCGPAIWNSTGSSAEIEAIGTVSACGHSVRLEASQMPQNQFGYFLNSQTQASTFPVPNSQGTLCVGGAIGRYTANVFSTGSTGTGSLQLDLANTPTPSGPVPILAGQTWNFTAWFRDLNPNATSNFTNAVSIAFL